MGLVSNCNSLPNNELIINEELAADRDAKIFCELTKGCMDKAKLLASISKLYQTADPESTLFQLLHTASQDVTLPYSIRHVLLAHP